MANNIVNKNCDDPYADSYDEAEGYTAVQTCPTCKYIYNHPRHFAHKHYSCLCFFFHKKSVCCLRAFEDMILDIPGFISLLNNNPEWIPKSFTNMIIKYAPYGTTELDLKGFYNDRPLDWCDYVNRYCIHILSKYSSNDKYENLLFKEKFSIKE